MKKYILKRLVSLVFVILGISFLSFFSLHLSGDPTGLLLSPDATEQEVAEFREIMGFNDSIIVQYARYLNNILHGDFGKSLYYKTPAIELVMERLPATIKLTLAAMILSLLIAIPVGILSAKKRNSITDYGGMLFTLIAMSVAHFWLGIMLILVFAVKLQWLPTSGYGGVKYIILPAVALSANLMALFARVIRSNTLEILNKDYIRTARAKGLTERTVIYKHVFRNTLIPFITILGIQFSVLLGGTVIVENIFAWPGVGRLVIQAIWNRDYPVVQAAVIFLAIVCVTVNLIVDILYAYLDPQISYTKEKI